MRPLLFLGVFLSCALSAAGDASATALEALKLLPRGQAKNLARIEAREGTPEPERWHLLVHDKETESGVREYVIAGGEIVASRGISQFAETITAADVMGVELMRIDSVYAAKLLQQYASANELAVSTLSYELRKDGAEAVPLWRVTGYDDAGKEVGTLVLTANKGTVISHPGFDLEPTPSRDKEHTFQPQANRTVATAEPVPGEESLGREERTGNERERRPGLLRRAGGTLQKFFTGRNSISR